MLDTTPHAEDAQILQLTDSFHVKGSVCIAPNFSILQTYLSLVFWCVLGQKQQKKVL